MSEKRFTLDDESRYIMEYGMPMTILDVVMMLNKQQATIEQLRQSQDVKEFSALFNQSIALQREIKDLKEENEKLQELATRTEEEKEHYADLYNQCRRFKLSDELIKQAYADLNRREREKHSPRGNVTYISKNQTEVIY